MSRNNSSGKSGKPDPRRGGGFRRPQQTEKQPAVASGLSRSTVTSDLRMLSANANSDELDKWLKSLQTHSTLTFDEGVIEKYFQDPLYTYRQPAAPVVPDPDDEEEVQVNPRASSGADIDLLTVSADHLRRVALGGKLVQQPLDEQTKLMPTSIPGTDSNPRYTAVYLELEGPVFTVRTRSW